MCRQSIDSAHFHYTGAGVQEDTRSRQVGGTHYVNKTIQPWDAMAAWMTHEAFCGFLAGNVIKYLARYKDKGGLDDLLKSRHYLDKLIEVERDKK